MTSSPNGSFHLTLAELLDELSSEIEDLGGTLCSDAQFALTHLPQLQAIDLIAQKQRAIAKLLSAECLDTAIATIELEALLPRVQHHSVA